VGNGGTEYPISNKGERLWWILRLFGPAIARRTTAGLRLIKEKRQRKFEQKKVTTLNQNWTFITQSSETVEKFFNLKLLEEIF